MIIIDKLDETIYRVASEYIKLYKGRITYSVKDFNRFNLVFDGLHTLALYGVNQHALDVETITIPCVLHNGLWFVKDRHSIDPCRDTPLIIHNIASDIVDVLNMGETIENKPRKTESAESNTLEDTLHDRAIVYGDYLDNADLSSRFDDILKDYKSKLSSTHWLALNVIFQKIARVLNGDPDYKDNWLDIQGYCERVLEDIDRRAK